MLRRPPTQIQLEQRDLDALTDKMSDRADIWEKREAEELAKSKENRTPAGGHDGGEEQVASKSKGKKTFTLPIRTQAPETPFVPTYNTQGYHDLAEAALMEHTRQTALLEAAKSAAAEEQQTQESGQNTLADEQQTQESNPNTLVDDSDTDTEDFTPEEMERLCFPNGKTGKYANKKKKKPAAGSYVNPATPQNPRGPVMGTFVPKPSRRVYKPVAYVSPRSTAPNASNGVAGNRVPTTKQTAKAAEPAAPEIPRPIDLDEPEPMDLDEPEK